MANTNASIRLRFFADDSAVKRSIKSMRGLASAAGGASKAFGRGAFGGFTGQGRDELGRFTKGAFGQVGANLHLVGQSMSMIGGQIRSALEGPIRAFAEFDQTMAATAGRMGNVTSGELAEMTAAAQKLGATTMLSAQQGAEGMFELAGAGLNAKQAIAALPSVGALAEAQTLSLGDATRVAISTMSQFGLQVKDVGRINDVLNTTANSAAITFTEVAEALSYAGQQADLSGISLERTGVMIAAMGNAGLRGSSAGTSLAQMLAHLAKRSPGAVKALRKIGLEAKDMAAGVTDPVTLLSKLNDQFAARNVGEADKLGIMMQVFGARAVKSAAAIMKANAAIDPETGLTGFELLEQKMAGAEGATKSMAERMRASAGGQIKLFESQVESTAIMLGKQLFPALRDIFKEVKPVVEQFGQWARDNPDAVKSWGKLVMGLGGFLTIAGPVALALGTVHTLVTGIGAAARFGLAPVRMLGGGIMALQTRMTAAGTTASLWGARMVGAVGVASAAFAGWQLGSLLDEWIGKMLNLRKNAEGVASISGELGHLLGESEGFNVTMKALGFGDLAAGNREANKMVIAKGRGIGAAVDAARTAPQALQKRGLDGGPREDKLAVDVTVKDDRVTAKPRIERANRPIDLRTQPVVP